MPQTFGVQEGRFRGGVRRTDSGVSSLCALDRLVPEPYAQTTRISGARCDVRCVTVLLSEQCVACTQTAFQDQKTPKGWKRVPSNTNSSEACGADIKKSSMIQCKMKQAPTGWLAGGSKKLNLVDCVDHVFRYCSRIQKDFETVAGGGAVRYGKGTAPQRKPHSRPASIKPDHKKRRRSHSGSSRGSRKRVRFDRSDGRGPDRGSDFDDSEDSDG